MNAFIIIGLIIFIIYMALRDTGDTEYDDYQGEDLDGGIEDEIRFTQYKSTPIYHDERDKGEPWYGRQYLGSDDPDDMPNSAPTWYEVFNCELIDAPDFLIEYADRHGVITERKISPTSIHRVMKQPFNYIKAWCHLRKEARTFRVDRIMTCKNLATNRKIKHLGFYLVKFVDNDWT